MQLSAGHSVAQVKSQDGGNIGKILDLRDKYDHLILVSIVRRL